MRDLLWDVRYACRRLTSAPLVSLAAVATLAVGVSATVVMGDLIDRLLLRPPPHVTDPDRVVRLYDVSRAEQPRRLAITNPALEAFVNEADPTVEALAAYLDEELTLGQGAAARRVRSVAHTAQYFQVLGLAPYVGQLPDRTSADRDSLVVVSYRFWQQHLGGEDDAVGRRLLLNDEPWVVAAVLPRGFAGVDNDPVDVWLPLSRRGERLMFPQWETYDRAPTLRNVIARLRPGARRAEVADRLTAAFAVVDPNNSAEQFRVQPGHLLPARAPGAPAEVTVTLWLGVLSALVLLVACGNVGTLLGVRAVRRNHDVTIKLAVGATRGRLMRELWLEAFLLALLTGSASLCLVTIGGSAVRELLLPPVAALLDPIDARLVAATAAICVLASVLLAMLPGWRLWRAHAGGGAPVPGRYSEPRSLQAFVGLQVALTVPLLLAAGLFVSSLWNAQQQNFGLRTADIVVVHAPMHQVQRGGESDAVHRQLQASLEELPQVLAVTMAHGAPLKDWFGFTTTRPGGERLPGGRTPRVHLVDPTYTEVLGIPVVEGRELSDADNRAGARPVMLANRALARRVWPGESAVGKCLHLGPSACVEIVGVTADTAQAPSFEPARLAPEPELLLPIDVFGYMQSGRLLLVRTSGGADAARAAVAERARAALPNLPYVDVWKLDDLFEPVLRPWRVGAQVLVGFGLLSLLIAAAGLAVLSTYAVTHRTRELGIRAAIGAEPAALVRFMLARTVRAVVAGLVVGLFISWTAAGRLDSLLYGIAGHDLRVFGVVASVLLVVGTAAAWVPARRAGRIDPVAALRTE